MNNKRKIIRRRENVKGGLTNSQSHRILEDIQTIALVAELMKQTVETLGRDVQGMIQGNKKDE